LGGGVVPAGTPRTVRIACLSRGTVMLGGHEAPC
jgi:hypothetical protein